MSHDAFNRIRGSGLPPLSSLSGSTNASFSTGGTSSSVPGENCSRPPNDISLATPRPQNQRASNVYVDTPFKHVVPFQTSSNSNNKIASNHFKSQNFPLVHGTNSSGRLLPSHQKQYIFKKPSQHGEPSSLQSQNISSSNFSQNSIPQATSLSIISQQPKTFKKDIPDDEESIICNRCGRCRCEACSLAKVPGGVWLFGGKCHCSPSEAVDFLSCLCCVKGVLYHCGKDSEEDVPVVDRLCSCSGPNAAWTWLCLGAATVPLPCLLCYWPLTWIRKLCEGTYLRFNTHGCRCDPSHLSSVPSRPQTPPSFPEKRLLQDCM